MFVRRSFALLAVSTVALLWIVPAALADTGDIIEPQNHPGTAKNGWQAGTCTTDTPKCSPATDSQFYRTAGGHPPVGFTQYIIQHTVTLENVIEPLKAPIEERDIRKLRVDLPPGLVVNPQSTTEKCSLAEFLHSPAPGVFVPECKAATKTGEEQANLVTTEAEVEFPPGSGEHIANAGTRLPLIPGVFQIPVYNLQPFPGEPALFGFVVAAEEPIFLKTEVSWESDFHESFTITIPASIEASGSGLGTIISRLVNFGQATGNGTYITNPTTCFDPEEASTEHLYSTYFRADSFADENPTFPVGSTTVEAGLPEGIRQYGCPKVPFDPSIEVEPETHEIDSPAPASVTAEMPFEVPSGEEHTIGQSHLRKAEVTMPQGMGLNPSASVGLEACTDAQFHKGERTTENGCPAGSEVGSIEIDTPALSSPLAGKLYVGEQQSTDPTSGDEYRVLAEAKSTALGIVVRLVGNVSANPVTGQLKTTFYEKEVSPIFGELPGGLPQVPFEELTLRFDGSHTVLTSPPTCAAAKSTSTMEPWSTPASTAHPTSEFTLTSAPDGGACPTTLGARKFAPAYTAKSEDTKAGAYSPFDVKIFRADGEQELKLADVSLPPGLAGKLSGVPYCSDASLAAAAANSGKAEQSSPSCSSSSQIGVTTTESGTGSTPASLPGKAYLAGPYKGAPLSMAVITPAVSGPFDLGTVVVRIALEVDPESTQVRAVSDVIPDVYGGTKLDIRSIDLNINRTDFTHNPTNCDPKSVSGTLSGGGSDPTNPAAFSSYGFSVPYQASDCSSLGFKPKLTTELLGGRNATRRRSHPEFKSTLVARSGDANVARTALTLPPGLLLDNAHIGTVCTRPQLAANECPPASIYGKAWATSPLLEQKLAGAVYLVPSNSGGLPDLLLDLRGQLDVQLRGIVSSSKSAGMKTVFPSPPDAPVTKLVLRMFGGTKGLLINSKDLCKIHKLGSTLNMRGQNGKQIKRQKKNKLPLKLHGCPKHKKHHKKHHR